MINNLRGVTRSGQPLVSYNDAGYDKIDASVEAKLGLPSGSLSGLRLRGERSNADQVSEAGARSVYQIIPATRDAVMRKYGVDAYAGPEQAATAAGHILQEGLTRNGGDIAKAVAEYHGGTNPANWGPRTAAYVARTVGRADGDTLDEPASGIGDQTTPDFLQHGNGTAGTPRLQGGIGPDLRDKPSKMDRARADAAAFGGVRTPNGPAEGAQAGLGELQEREAGEVAAHSRISSTGFVDRLAAGFQENSLAAALWRRIDAEHPEADPAWVRRYMANRDALEGFARSDDEVAWLRESTSMADYDRIKSEIEAKRKRLETLNSGGSTQALVASLAGGVADPAGWLAGFGVGKAFQVAGIGARSLYLSGRVAAAAGSLAAEGALGNVAVTAGLDVAGEHMTTTDYAAAAGFGMAIGAGLAPLHLRGVRNQELETTANAIRERAADNLGALRIRAMANVGEGDENALNLEMRRLDAEDRMSLVRQALADVPDEHRLFGQLGAKGEGLGLLTADAATRADIIQRHSLDAMPDEGMRAVAAEYLARAERIARDNPVDAKALNTVLKLGNLESTSNTLLSSNNPLAKAFALVALENGQGAGGRRATAAITQNTRERVYLRELAGWDAAYHSFRKGEGIGQMREAWTGDARRAFNRRVYAEREARSQGLASSETNRAILDAADMLDRGYNLQRLEAQRAGIVGHARLGEDSVGYQPHRIMAAKAATLVQNPEQRRAVARIISDQLQGESNAYEWRNPETGEIEMRRWDKAFADSFATKYLDDAARRAMGGWDMPVNLHDPEAADIVFDTARSLGLSGKDADALLGKFSRGGASFTKARLRLNLLADIPDGRGGSMKLMDLFNQDSLSLYRAYARRMSGEVALAQYGVQGKNGLATIRDTMRVTGADANTLRAFDQVAAEFLNSPFGEANHKFLDNVRILTSLSRLGGMGFTQLGEYGNALPVLGVARTLQAVSSFKRLAAEVGQLGKGGDTTNAILADIDSWAGGVGVSEFHFTRMFDVPDNDIQLYNAETVGLATRVLRAGGNLQAALSGHRMITAVQVRGMAEGLVRKAVEYSRRGIEDKALDDIGIGAGLRSRIRQNLDRIATFDAAGRVQELRLLDGDLTPAEVQEIRQSILRGANQIIQHTFTGETGKWAHHGFLKLLTQFRTFGVISVEKQFGRNLANYGALKSFAYIVGAMSFAAPIHLARLHMRTLGMSRKEREDYLRQNLTVAGMARATASYVSGAGLAADVYDVGTGVAGGWIGPDFGDNFGIRGQGRASISGLVPALGVVDDAYKAANGNPHKLKTLLPFANLPYVQPLLAALGN